MSKNVEVYLALGTNIGDREKNIQEAISQIREYVGNILLCSSILQTIPEGFHSTNLFLNAVVKVATTLSPMDLLKTLKNIEKNMGRTYTATDEYEDRIIDIDIIFYDTLTLDSDILSIPHKLYENRIFVLKPLAEIAPEFRDPRSGKLVKELYCSLLKK